MELKDIVAISGLSGLHRVVANRNDGLIVHTFGEEKPRFVSSRIHMFTPLDSITIYTIDDNIELAKVLQTMKEKEDNVPPVSPKASNNELKNYFVQVIPDYDQERVYTSDIKKIIKWYQTLDQFDMFNADNEDASAEEASPANNEAESDASKKETRKENKKAQPEEEDKQADDDAGNGDPK